MRRDINDVHRHITRLATLGESVTGWKETDSTRYHTLRLHTDSLLQALKPRCTAYVHPAQIDTLRTILTEKEAHLWHIMEAMERQDDHVEISICSSAIRLLSKNISLVIHKETNRKMNRKGIMERISVKYW